MLIEETEKRVESGEIKEKTLGLYRQAIYQSDTEETWRTKPDAIRLETEMGNLSIAEAGDPGFLTDYLWDVFEDQPGVATLHYTVLSRLFKLLTRQKLFDVSPIKLIERPKKKPGQQRAVTTDERGCLYRMLVVHRRNPRAARWLMPFVLTLLGTGVRTSEGLALRWCDLDLTDECGIAYIGATIVKVAGKPPYRQPNRKRGKAYYIVLPNWLTAILREWKAVCQPPSTETLVFRARNGGRNSGIIAPTTADAALDRLRAGTALSWLQFGNLRDTVATEVMGRTGDSRRAGAQLGHAEGSSMVTRHYIDPNGYVHEAVDNAEVLEFLAPVELLSERVLLAA
ncbi:site-specific integrase [Nocardia iowensis]|uniref:Tyrosine-type recombinase/integrase n=1 Tax=Nocardia iowensis TaxID=204891 RepID=A0ABX8RSI8_NOCIO|nr:site-specific integrase [Nocardia iowensis]QXN92604.1 tyrosine-type recombinase/integrase [Nocardia iowensis]